MNEANLLNFAQVAIVIALKLSLIPIVVATVLGLLVSLLQALTQVQEQTLGFAIKLIAISITLILAGPWLGSEMLRYTDSIFSSLVKM